MDIIDDRDEIRKNADFMTGLIQADMALPLPLRIMSEDGLMKLRIFAAHAHEMSSWPEPVSWQEYLDASNRICDG